MRAKYKTLLIISISLLFLLAACGQDDGEQADETAEQPEEETNEQSNYPEDVEENPVVTITMENDEQITAELYPEIAPNTVANFVSLVEDGFYDGLIFHRVIPGFMIQGGDPEGNGTGNPGYAIPGEFSSNGFENDLEHDRGVLSMARSQDPDSAGSQFFIMTELSPHLDGDYAAFGEVTEGMEVADEIVSAERDDMDRPLEDQQMKEVTVDTKGYDYPEPEKVD
ncbi:peptidylprolyl isomerase [Virgibacillus sp. YIM 98842]|uniref:peptidylprolyl isomerase n=1 Tax=Virgibacillus sp. YIM 98842 TaxID=2663533 RepID=UPI0013DC63E0|nr:peptidylprolyl isomerase [Virgibacillus sp. YIM 98842]